MIHDDIDKDDYVLDMIIIQDDIDDDKMRCVGIRLDLNVV